MIKSGFPGDKFEICPPFWSIHCAVNAFAKKSSDLIVGKELHRKNSPSLCGGTEIR